LAPDIGPILVIEQFADQYHSRILAAFPRLEIRTAVEIDQARSLVADVSALFGFGSSFDDALIKSAKALEWLHFLSSGTDSLARLLSADNRFIVTSSHGVHGPSASEMVFLHMLTLARNYALIRQNQNRAVWHEFDQPLLYKKVIVVLGTGLISRALAERCKSFGMTVVGVSSKPRDIPFFDRVVDRRQFRKVAGEADFLVLLAPLTSETRGIVDAELLGVMKPTAYLINVGRGPLCNEVALAEAVRAKRIAGAGLDTFCTEPLPPDHPFWSMENVTITPHIGGRSDCYADLVMPILVHNLGCFIDRRFSEMKNVKATPAARAPSK
jgi:phosphoglycerate dehydrogenase-like enzyme